MKILTFNHHESYLATLSLVGHQFDVVTKVGDLDLGWNVRARPVPANFELVKFDADTRQKLRDGTYDVVICHTIKNLLWLWLFFKPRYIFVAHIPLFKMTLTGRLKSIGKRLIWKLFKWTHNAHFLAVSEFKRASWGEHGTVAVLAPGEFPALNHDNNPAKILIVCNNLAERGEELGIKMIERLAKALPIHTVGNNPGIPFNIKPKNFADFQQIISGFCIYLYTIKMPWGDGYNTAMLEAMRMGMAVVTVANPSSPIIDGVNGLVGKDEDELANHLKHLLGNPELVRRLGNAAAETIKSSFSEEKFIQSWRFALEH